MNYFDLTWGEDQHNGQCETSALSETSPIEAGADAAEAATLLTSVSWAHQDAAMPALADPPVGGVRIAADRGAVGRWGSTSMGLPTNGRAALEWAHADYLITADEPARLQPRPTE